MPSDDRIFAAVAEVRSSADTVEKGLALIIIPVLTALAMFAVAHTANTQDRVIGAPDCVVEYRAHETQADDLIGSKR